MIQAMTWALVLTSGRRDVPLGADEDLDLGREPAGQALELLLAELLGVDDDAALAAAVRDADDGALPGHPHREGLDLVEARRPGGSGCRPWRGRGPRLCWTR